MDEKHPPFDRLRWALCVLFAVVPLLLFLLVLWVFSGMDPPVTTVVSTLGSSPDDFFAFAVARVGIIVLNYGAYVFAHSILCLGAIAYFWASMRSHATAAGRRIEGEISIAAAFAVIVCGAIVLMTVNREFEPIESWSVFSGLFIAPLGELFSALDLDSFFSHYPDGTTTFLYLSVLVPTLFGTVTVVAATASFHFIVLCREDTDAPGWQESFIYCITVLKRQLTVLSVILVSSVLTSRFYVHFMPSLIDPENKAAHSAYADLAGALSFSSGLLFTATLFAAFTPGVVLLLKDVMGVPVEGAGRSLHAILEKLQIDNPTKQISAVVRVALTLVAPALAGPVMNILSTAVG